MSQARRRSRGGKRTRRSATNTETQSVITAALRQLRNAAANMGPQHCQEGIYGISHQDLLSVEAAHIALRAREIEDPRISRALTDIDDFFFEYEQEGYVTQRAETCLDRACEQLAALTPARSA